MYFSRFPNVLHQATKDTRKQYALVDITANVRFRREILEKVNLFDIYIIKDGETPEIVSEKLYGTPYYHWVLMLLNEMYDYRNDWPLTDKSLDAYIIKKYGSLEAAKARVLYFLDEDNNVVTPGNVTEGGVEKFPLYVNEDEFDISVIRYFNAAGVQVTQPLYNGLGTPLPVFAYNYEVEVNERKRRVRVVSKPMVEAIAASFRDLI